MTINRHFLGWDEPPSVKIGSWLLDHTKASGPVDLHDTLIVVPTLQAGRILREELARRCHENQSVLLSATIATPHYFFASQPDRHTASPLLSKAVWTHVLQKTDLDRFSGFFPGPERMEGIDSFRWALNTGELVERLRHDLADGGYTIPGVIEIHGDCLEELDRWNSLAELEKIYLGKLEDLGFADACSAKMSLADEPQLDKELRRIIVAGVPDPTLLAIRALENLSRERAIDILVHAPETERDKFDAWGRPDPQFWTKEEVEIPEWKDRLFLEASPETQARKVAEILTGLPTEYGPADIAIGAPDPSVMPFLRKELRAIGLPAFDPSGAQLTNHPLGRLVDAMSNLLQKGAYENVADLLRHPDFLGYLFEVHEIQSRALLAQLDEFQNKYLPVTLENMLSVFNTAGKHGSGRDTKDFSVLKKTLGIISEFARTFESDPMENAWRQFLKEIYSNRSIKPDAPRDVEFQNAAATLEDTFRELREIPADALELDKGRLRTIFAHRLQERDYDRKRTDELTDMQGWLELPWSSAPVMVITGMNEDTVPGGSLSDVFLPDSLRKILNLRDDLSRFGRDVFLLRCMTESRRRDGWLCLIAGKHTVSGDPLRPSRLLFRCAVETLPGRARLLFQPIVQAGQLAAAELIFPLKPAAAEPDNDILEGRRISTTAFRDYLACPFRFYLKHILKMEPMGDDKNEMDALDFGSLVHEVLQMMGNDKGLWNCRDAARLGDKLAELADQLAARNYGRAVPPAALFALSSARARLRAFAREQVELAAAGWEIIEAEQKRVIVRNGFTITGKIDRVDRNRNNGAIRIIDYKTSDNDKEPGSEHMGTRSERTADYNRILVRGKADKRGNFKEKEKKWTDLQLPLYRMMIIEKNKTEANVELAYFVLTKNLAETGLKVWTDFDDATADSAATCIDGVLADISRRRFWPPEEKVPYEDEFARLFLDSPDNIFDITGFPP